MKTKQAYQLALEEAQKSQCVRRQYGCVIFNGLDDEFVASYNTTVTACCKYGCMRNRLSVAHAVSTDVGAQVHAETATLILNGTKKENQMIILAGVKDGNELCDEQAYPCYACAKAIQFAGFYRIWIRNCKGYLEQVSLRSIFNYYEQVWEASLNV